MPRARSTRRVGVVTQAAGAVDRDGIDDAVDGSTWHRRHAAGDEIDDCQARAVERRRRREAEHADQHVEAARNDRDLVDATFPVRGAHGDRGVERHGRSRQVDLVQLDARAGPDLADQQDAEVRVDRDAVGARAGSAVARQVGAKSRDRGGRARDPRMHDEEPAERRRGAELERADHERTIGDLRGEHACQHEDATYARTESGSHELSCGG
jgi:hypothetical protein